MKVDLEIISLDSNGDTVAVSAQGKRERDANWRPLQSWRFAVPEHIGSKYRLGQKLRITINPVARKKR